MNLIGERVERIVALFDGESCKDNYHLRYLLIKFTLILFLESVGEVILDNCGKLIIIYIIILYMVFLYVIMILENISSINLIGI
jgi:hypothetical protein